ncbi:hypothetical protein EDD27_9254 [Nonomuraea polychroma]|uniref:Uncharacterized protein n=2 Tax=Nonomuraea polychroma TaxID=46176 RepID=A0A438MKX3_9ACTN|nr:hypothetical protein EDD27_9254 [Nonomuraea polychroma]
MYEDDPINPLYREPGDPGVWWQVAELFDKGMQPYLDENDEPVEFRTVGAVLVRKLTKETLGLNDVAWRAMLIQMGLSLDSKHLTMTKRACFFGHHIVRVRRPDPTPESEALRKQLAD